MGSQIVEILGVRKFWLVTGDLKMDRFAVKKIVTERTVALSITFIQL